MSKWLVVLVVALSLLVSTDAVAAPPENTVSKLSAPSVNGQRMLRGLKSTDDAADEERVDTTTIAQKLKSALSKTKLGQKLQELKQAKILKRETFVKKLLEDKASFETLHKNKVTPVEFLKAAGIDLAKLPKANAAIRVPEYGKFKRYKLFVERENPTRVIPDRHGYRLTAADVDDALL